VFPFELRVGDLVLVAGETWEITGRVESIRAGKGARARAQLPGRPETSKLMIWEAYERVKVQRHGADAG
jgi:hypothetical protein